MNIGDVINCDYCLGEITLDALEIADGLAWCLNCSKYTEIPEEEEE